MKKFITLLLATLATLALGAQKPPILYSIYTTGTVAQVDAHVASAASIPAGVITNNQPQAVKLTGQLVGNATYATNAGSADYAAYSSVAGLAQSAQYAGASIIATNAPDGHPLLSTNSALNGALLATSSVNSNALDASTKAQLALAGTGGLGGTATNLVSGLRATNFTTIGQVMKPNASTSAGALTVTNMLGILPELGTAWKWTNTAVMLFNNGGVYDPENLIDATGLHFYWLCRNGSYFDMLFNPYHERADTNYANPFQSEMQITSSGGAAFSAGYGLGTSYSAYSTARRCWQWGIGGYGQPYIYHQYGAIPHSWETNIFDSAFPEFWKAMVYTNAPGATPSYVWAGSKTTDDGSGVPAMMFRGYDTNGNGAWTWFDNLSWNVNSSAQWNNLQTATKRFEIVAGNAPVSGVNIYGGIRMNGAAALTTNYALGNGATLLITNGLIMAITNYPPFAMESETVSFLARITTETNTALATNVNNFVIALKSAGLSTNDPVYPFVGANADTNGQNLWSSSYTIKWSGTWGTNNQYGIHGGAGGNAYGDTQWKPITTNGYLFSFVKADKSGFTYLCGAQDTRNTRIYHNSSAQFSYAYNETTGGALLPPTWPSAVSICRSNDFVFSRQGTVENPPGAVTGDVVNANMFVFARNSGGPNYYYDGWAQGFAFGTNVLSQAQHLALYSAWTNLNAALGR